MGKVIELATKIISVSADLNIFLNRLLLDRALVIEASFVGSG